MLYNACCSTNLLEQAVAYQHLWDYLYRVAFQVVYDQPEAEAMAQDVAQMALIRVHDRLEECRDPQAFRAWAARIASRLAIDELRRGKRLIPLHDAEDEEPAISQTHSSEPSPEGATLERMALSDLADLIQNAPISQRSRRVVLGRYLDDLPDEQLARLESELTEERVLPSHIQVTRSKDIARLRSWEPLRVYLAPTQEAAPTGKIRSDREIKPAR